MNIIHRDIKPENILLTELPHDINSEFTIKLIDFGTSALVNLSKKVLQNVIKVSKFSAPEVHMNDYNDKCDEWSLGVVMYTMLSGMEPFRGRTE